MAGALPEGYGCEVVNSPHKYESECPICLQLIRDAHRVSCCGQYFCRECIELILRRKKRCPLCNNQDFTVEADRERQESLGKVKVRCSHDLSGCEWTGELQNFEWHLNEDATPSKAFLGCEYAKLPCGDCGEFYNRFCMSSHQEFCPKRQLTCPFCQAWGATYKEVVDEHWPVCEHLPVDCPNECGAKPSRRNLLQHVQDHCPFTIALRSSSIQKDVPGTSTTAPLASEKPLIISTATSKCTYTTMEKFHQYVNTKKTWYSKPFYTHDKGYRICISSVIKTVDSELHLTIAAHIMQGEFDDHLRWPLRGVLEIHIQSPPKRASGDNTGINLEIDYNAATPAAAAQRVFGEDGRGEGWGCSQSVPLQKISPRYPFRNSPRYVVDDSLKFRIKFIGS